MKNVKFLQTSAGTYGLANAGDELVLKNSVAEQLEKAGTVEITGDAGEDAEESVPTKGSVRFADETGKSAAPAGETNTKNPTGPDTPAAKATPLKSAKKSTKK
jgi:hypothetical protein